MRARTATADDAMAFAAVVSTVADEGRDGTPRAEERVEFVFAWNTFATRPPRMVARRADGVVVRHHARPL